MLKMLKPNKTGDGFEGGSPMEASKARVCCVSPGTALQILDIYGRVDQPRPASVNVCGEVLAVSPVTQVKDSCLLLIKFLPGVDIIIKKKELLCWNELLIPNKEYVITGLRPTTLKKGGSRQSRVYTVTSGSELMSQEDVTVDRLGLQQWLQLHKLPWPCDDPAPTVTQQTNLFSYQGTVTQVLDRVLGVFELDNDVRLHIGQVPAIPSLCSLQVGETVKIHNAHHRHTSQSPRLLLFGCMLCSTIRQKPETAAAEKVRQPSPILQKYLYLYELSQQRLALLFSLRCTLYRQFQKLLDKREIERIFTTILAIETLSWKQTANGQYRNLLDEFLCTPHTCGLSSDMSTETLPEYVTVSDILGKLACPVQDGPRQWHCSRHTAKEQVLLGILSTCETTGQCVLYDGTGSVPLVTCCLDDNTNCSCTVQHSCNEQCSCIQVEKGEHLPCKYLHTCCSGKLVALRRFVAVCETVSDNVTSPAACGTSTGKCMKYLCVNLKEAIVFGHKSKCEKRSEEKTSETRKTSVSTGKQEVALTARSTSSEGNQIECDLNKGPENEVKSLPSLHKHVLEDGTTRFCRNVSCGTSLTGNSTQTRSTETKENIYDNAIENGEKRKLTELLDKTLAEDMDIPLVSVKPVRKVIGNCTVTEVDLTQCKTCADSSIRVNSARKQCQQIPPKQHIEKELGQAKISCIDELKVNKLSFPPSTSVEGAKDNAEQPCIDQGQISVDDTCVTVCLLSKEALRQNKETTSSEALMTCFECKLLRDDIKKRLKVMLQGPSLRWYPCLYPGGVYRLTAPRGCPPLLTPHASNKKLRHAAEKSNQYVWRVAHDEMEVEELSGIRDDGDTEPSSSILHARATGKDFADVDGVIVKRVSVRRDQQNPDVHSRPSIHGDNARGDSVNTRLDVREATSGKIMQVYMDHGNISLPLGLIPGAVLTFSRLECITSRSGNIYYRFLYLTSVHIKCLGTVDKAPGQIEPQVCGAPARVHLVELWTGQSRAPVFQCVCQVCQIPKLSLKCVCEFCGSTVVKARCTNVACFGGESAELLARASVIVDDGTSVAMVTMSGSCVQRLLQLSAVRWSAVEDETRNTGEVFVQQSKQCMGSGMEQLTYMLCDNRLVKGSWLMTLRRKTSGKDTLDLDQIDLDEFAQKTFDAAWSRITTHCLPFLQLECVAMETFNPAAGSNHYLANM